MTSWTYSTTNVLHCVGTSSATGGVERDAQNGVVDLYLTMISIQFDMESLASGHLHIPCSRGLLTYVAAAASMIHTVDELPV